MKDIIKDLYNYTWGLGIEHEMHLFHKPIVKSTPITDFTLFDSYSVIQKLLEEKDNSK